VILGSVTTLPQLIQGHWIAPSSSVTESLPSKWLQAPLFSQQAVPRIIRQAQSSVSPALLPGDLVLAINGHLPYQYGCYVDALAQYLRSTQQLCLLIARHHEAVSVACHQHEVRLRSGLCNLHQSSCFAAQAANIILAPYFAPTRKAAPKRILGTPTGVKQIPSVYTNPLFVDSATGKQLPYDDTYLRGDPDEGTYAQQFLHPYCTTDFSNWLSDRKRKWRSSYKVYPYTQTWIEEECIEKGDSKKDWDRSDCTVSIDFWTSQGYDSFQQWMNTSKLRWKQSYLWNKQKRRRIEDDVNGVVHLEDGNFTEWLRIRKNQWLVQRRKRQRERLKDAVVTPSQPADNKPSHELSLEAPELVFIDAMLEEKEKENRKKQEMPPLDLVRLMDPVHGCPDDVLVHCLSFLPALEHGKLRCINTKTRNDLELREVLWQQLCPSHWTLPRRPRKTWCELYLAMLRRETENARKKWDDVLSKGSSLLWKGDHVQSLEKLVAAAEKAFQFDINYTSGVVCERNSLLNLAVIHQRHKVVRWLVTVKGADIESYDRGGFTPLLNAAYAGDRHLIRFLLQQGADRSKIGQFHYTKPLCSPDFEGFTAEGWADHKGFPELARLIRLGL
jgi:hypothetical protein